MSAIIGEFLRNITKYRGQKEKDLKIFYRLQAC